MSVLAVGRSVPFESVWRRHGGLLGLVVAALALLFHRDVADLAGIYWNSETFGHCLLVLPIFAWLVWQRREGLVQLTPTGWWPGLIVVAGGALAWLIGAAAGVAVLRHLGLIVMMQGSAIATLGPNVARALAFPLGWLFFLVPFGQSIEAPLQDLTVRQVMPLLVLTGVPATYDGVLIVTPDGVFEVAEECSGARFVLAMLAFAVLAANVCFRTWPRRIAFVAFALAMPVLANGLRAWGTIYAAHLTSVEAATGFDHIVYGWVFFGLVMALVIALAWPWFDRDVDTTWFDPATLQRAPRFAAALLPVAGASLGIAVAAAGWAHAIDARAAALPTRIELPQLPGWRRVPIDPLAPWTPSYPGADHFLIGRYADASGATVDLAIAVQASQREGKEIVGFDIGPIVEHGPWLRVADLAPLQGGAAMRIVHAGPVEREVVTWLCIGSILTGDPKRVKLETLRVKMTGGDPAAVAVLVSVEKRGSQDTRATIERFLATLGPVEALADRAAGRR
ncbi:EpsI domain-containing exosortase [Sphingomonas spermidinifaciens]|uniref:EpsI domain-containing exosortase n=1 Tax=Sphingomonas spermidinifaciens TaxID=1141889 RepID=A0A2A4B7D7_9SPHN|nr:exosortase A [Sphingomonas spermidinifaciens]PCD03554.1 EpsI domain-containing exosortase [Sphingomonas spermidinifaciens]